MNPTAHVDKTNLLNMNLMQVKHSMPMVSGIQNSIMMYGATNSSLINNFVTAFVLCGNFQHQTPAMHKIALSEQRKKKGFQIIFDPA